MNLRKNNYHWLVLASCCLMVAVSIGMFTNAYGVFYTPLSEELGVGRAAVALHSTIGGVLTGFAMPFIVKLMKKIRLQWMTIAGCGTLVLTLVLTAFANAVWQLNLLGVLRGMGCACIYLTVVNIVLANWFEKKYGTVVGIASSFSGLAGAVLSPLFSAVVNSMGYRNALLLGAALVFVLVLPGILFVRLRPEEMGLEPYGRKEANDGASVAEKRRAENGASTGDTVKGRDTVRTDTATDLAEPHFLKMPVFWLLIIGAFLTIFVTSFSQHVSGYTESIGLGTAVGVAMLSASMVGNISFKLLMGILTDVLGATKSVILFILTGAVGLVLILLSRSSVLMLAGAFLFGALYSVGTVGNATLSRQAFSKKQYSSAYSIMSLSGSASAALSITAIGAVYDAVQNYTPVLVGAILFCVVAVCCQVGAGRSMRQKR